VQAAAAAGRLAADLAAKVTLEGMRAARIRQRLRVGWEARVLM
jgi:hypothetical protein